MQLSTFNSQFSISSSIGVIDSGVGGMSVWREIVLLLPRESTIYIADQKNIPYGTKDAEEIYQLAKKLVIFLLEKKVKLIVIACNTITVTCLDRLRMDFPDIPIVGTVPVIKKATEVTKNKRIGVLSTTRTTKSNYQKELINKFGRNCQITSIGNDKLVPLIEEGIMGREELEKILQEELEIFKTEDVDTVVLGCTHFHFIRPTLSKLVGRKVRLLDSGAAIARQVKRILENNNSLSSEKASHVLYTTGNLKNKKVLSLFLGREDVRIAQVTLEPI